MESLSSLGEDAALAEVTGRHEDQEGENQHGKQDSDQDSNSARKVPGKIQSCEKQNLHVSMWRERQ